MPRSYSTAMSDIESGSPHDFAFLVAGVFIFLLYSSFWGKIKKTEPNTGYVFLATVATLIIIPAIWWYYLTVLTLVSWIPVVIWDKFLKPKGKAQEDQPESIDEPIPIETSINQQNQVKQDPQPTETSKKADGYLCPECKQNTLRRISGKYGFFWGCKNYPNCTATYDDKNGIPVFPMSAKTITTLKMKAQIEEAIMQRALQMTGMTAEEVQSLSVYEDKYDYKDKMVKKWELEKAKQTARSYIMNEIK